MTLRVSTWNVEWCQPQSAAADAIRERLLTSEPDIICLTESEADFLVSQGHTILCEADHGYPLKGQRRKVLLWSRHPWKAVDPIGHANLPPGRFVAGRTMTPAGPVLVIGVCVPWFGAHVSTGRRDRRRWEDHLSFLTHLGHYLTGVDEPCVLLGDFNQTVPRRRAPQPVYDALCAAVINHLNVVTTGEIGEFGHAIDHVATSRHFACQEVRGLSPVGEDGRPLTDHFGLATVLSRTG